MDLTESLAAKSDQLNAVDVPTPRTFTIEKITAGNEQQPFNFHLVETPGRPWRPSKGMRRVVARGWGEKNIADRYPGRRITLWCNPEVIYAGAPVGGLQVSHMSDITEPFTMPLRISQKKTGQITVQPLPADAPTTHAEPSPDEIAACTDEAELRKMWEAGSEGTRRLITERVQEIRAADATPDPEAAGEES